MKLFRNVLILCTDEQDPRHSGFSGSTMVQTPTLDRLAAGGTVFTHAYTPSPICVPARASMATGRWVHDHRCWDNALAYDGTRPSWGKRLQQAGTRTESIGKLHYRSADDDTGFDRQVQAMHISGSGQVWGSVRDPLPSSPPWSPQLFKQLGAGESEYNRFDDGVATRTIEWLTERAASPSETGAALFAGFVAPHFPFVVPQKYLDRYPLGRMPKAKLHPEGGYHRHPWVERLAQFNDLDTELGTDEQRALAAASYFGLITFIDEQIGRVLEALTALGLRDETLIIMTSDHGENLGTRGMWNKSLMYRESTGVPLILSGPGVPQGTCETNVTLADIFPTVLDALGVPPSADDAVLPGRSLLAFASEPHADRIAFSEYHAIGSPSAAFMLARGRYKYHHYVGYEPELFDIVDDPEELHDIHASRRDVAAEFDAQLRAMIDPDAVDRLAKADQNALIERHGGREAVLGMQKFGATPVPK